METTMDHNRLIWPSYGPISLTPLKETKGVRASADEASSTGRSERFPRAASARQSYRRCMSYNGKPRDPLKGCRVPFKGFGLG